jgi:hypothetical protein
MSDKRILTFEDLVFQKHSTIGIPEVSASMKFKNGGWILVVPLESSISRSTSSFVHWYDFEVMSSLAEDVLLYLTPDEVTEHMISIQMRVL